LALGVPPAALMAASMPLPDGVSESGYVGALVGEDIEVVKCETNDMYVPANCEIILEGVISNTETGPEGPFGEMHGYVYPADVTPIPCPLFKVNCITYRDNAILPVCPAGRAADETHTILGTMISAEIRHILHENKLPVKNFWTPFETQVVWGVVQVDAAKLRSQNTSAKEFCEKIGNLVFRSKAGWFLHRLLIVGEDIDPYNFKDVMWAYSTRCRPGMDDYMFDDVLSFFLVPFMGHGPGEAMKGGKCVSNCVLPIEYKGERDWITCDFEHAYTKEITDKINREWRAMGYDN